MLLGGMWTGSVGPLGFALLLFLYSYRVGVVWGRVRGEMQSNRRQAHNASRRISSRMHKTGPCRPRHALNQALGPCLGVNFRFRRQAKILGRAPDAMCLPFRPAELGPTAAARRGRARRMGGPPQRVPRLACVCAFCVGSIEKVVIHLRCTSFYEPSFFACRSHSVVAWSHTSHREERAHRRTPSDAYGTQLDDRRQAPKMGLGVHKTLHFLPLLS